MVSIGAGGNGNILHCTLPKPGSTLRNFGRAFPTHSPTPFEMADTEEKEVVAAGDAAPATVQSGLIKREGEEVFAVAHIFASFNDTFGACPSPLCPLAPPLPLPFPPSLGPPYLSHPPSLSSTLPYLSIKQCTSRTSLAVRPLPA